MVDSEARIERYLVDRVEALGGLCEKVAPIRAGVPDRLVVIAGRVHLVELKTSRGRIRPIQKHWHALALKAGYSVRILRSKNQVDEFLQEVI